MSSQGTVATGAAEQAPAEREIDLSAAAVERYERILELIDKNTRLDTIFTKLPWCTGRMVEDAKVYRARPTPTVRAPRLAPPPQARAPALREEKTVPEPEAPRLENKAKITSGTVKTHMRRADRILLNKLQKRVDHPLPETLPAPEDEPPTEEAKEREAKSMIDLVVHNAKNCFGVTDAELRVSEVSFQARPYRLAILLILNDRDVTAEQIAPALNMEVAAVRRYLSLAKEEVVGRTAVNRFTQSLCRHMGIAFAPLRRKI